MRRLHSHRSSENQPAPGVGRCGIGTRFFRPFFAFGRDERQVVAQRSSRCCPGLAPRADGVHHQVGVCTVCARVTRVLSVLCVCLSGNTGPASASLAYEPSAAKGMHRLLLRAPIFLSPSNRRGGWLSASTAVHVTPCSLGLSVADRSLIYIFLSLPFAWPTRPSSRRRTTNSNGQNPQRSRRRHRLGSFARSRQRGGPDCRKAGAAGPPSVTGLLRRQVNCGTGGPPPMLTLRFVVVPGP